jgi:hypothetical protein
MWPPVLVSFAKKWPTKSKLVPSFHHQFFVQKPKQIGIAIPFWVHHFAPFSAPSAKNAPFLLKTFFPFSVCEGGGDGPLKRMN